MPVRAKTNCTKTRRFDGEMVRNIVVLIGSMTNLSEDACHQVRDATTPEVARKRWLSERGHSIRSKLFYFRTVVG